MDRIVHSWLAVVGSAAVALYANVFIAVRCLDCAYPPSTAMLFVPWLLPGGMLIVALWVCELWCWIGIARRQVNLRDRK
jgi:hypothetical protein